MTLSPLFPLLCGTALLASCASSGQSQQTSEARAQEELTERLSGYTKGETQQCVLTSRLGNPVPYGDNVVVFSGTAGTIYVNRLGATCPGAGDESDIFVTEIRGSQLCENELLKRRDRYSGISGPSCSLGAFTEYKKTR